MTSRDAVVAEAREWIGTPFVHGQALKGIGCDCIGLVAGVAAALALPEAFAWHQDRELRNYGRQPQPGPLLSACAKYLDCVPARDVQLGDVLLMNVFPRVVQPMHFGYAVGLDPFYIVHGYEPAGGVVMHAIDARWRRRICGAFRLRGVG